MPRRSRFAFASSGDNSESELEPLTLSAWSSDDEAWLREVFLHPIASISTIPPPRADDLCDSAATPRVVREACLWTKALVPTGFDLAHPPNLADASDELDRMLWHIVHATSGASRTADPVTADLAGIAAESRPASDAGGLPDFVAESADMKRVMSIQLQEESVSVVVHRIGDTLFLDGELPAAGSRPPRRGVGPQQSAPARREFPVARGADSPPHAGVLDAVGSQPRGPDARAFSAGAASAPATRPSRANRAAARGVHRHRPSRRDAARPPAPASPSKEHELQSILYYSIADHGGAAGALDAGSMRPVSASARRAHAARLADPPRGADAAHGDASALPPSKPLRRVFTWQLEGIDMLLGSDMLIFAGEGVDGAAGAGAGATSVKLRDVEELITATTCVDLWLENVLNAADALALCYHNAGVVQGYQVVKTADIPALAGAREKAQACLTGAASILRFLKDHCSTDGASYVLHKAPHSQQICLYEIFRPDGAADAPPGDLAAASAPSDGQTGLHAPSPPADVDVTPTLHVPSAAAPCVDDSDADASAATLVASGSSDALLADAEGGRLRAGDEIAADFDMSEGAGPPGRAADSADSAPRRNPYAYHVAVLCYRMAVKTCEPGSTQDAPAQRDRRERCQQLLRRCVQLCQASAHPDLYAAAHLGLAELLLADAAAGADRPSLALTPRPSRARSDRRCPGSPPEGADSPGGGGVRASDDAAERLCSAAADHLAAGIDAVETFAPGGCLPTRTALKDKLCQVFARLAAIMMRQRAPGAALRAVAMAGCHLEPAGAKWRRAQAALLQLLHTAADAYVLLAELLLEVGPEAACEVAARQTRELLGDAGRRWRAQLGEGTSLTPAGQVPDPRTLGADAESNLSHAVQHYLAALKLFDATEGSSEREQLYERLVARLSAAYSRLGATLLRAGRLTKALQHFQQGVLLFQGVRAAACTAACYGALAQLFMLRNATLDAGSLDTLGERERNSQQSMKNFQLALQVLEGSKLRVTRALRRHIDRQLADCCVESARGLMVTLPVCSNVDDVARTAADMLRRALAIYDRLARASGRGVAPEAALEAGADAGAPLAAAAEEGDVALEMLGQLGGDSQDGRGTAPVAILAARAHASLVSLNGITLQLRHASDAAPAGAGTEQLLTVAETHARAALQTLSAAEHPGEFVAVQRSVAMQCLAASRWMAAPGARALVLEKAAAWLLECRHALSDDLACAQSLASDLCQVLKGWIQALSGLPGGGESSSSASSKVAVVKRMYKTALTESDRVGVAQTFAALAQVWDSLQHKRVV